EHVRREVVDVEQELRAPEARKERRDHEEVGRIVHLDDVVPPTAGAPRRVDGCQRREKEILAEQSQRGSALPMLDRETDHLYPLEDLLVRLALAAQREDIDLESRRD